MNGVVLEKEIPLVTLEGWNSHTLVAWFKLFFLNILYFIFFLI